MQAAACDAHGAQGTGGELRADRPARHDGEARPAFTISRMASVS
jgi:hypothetical protein